MAYYIFSEFDIAIQEECEMKFVIIFGSSADVK